jgi:hypothetical protein
LRTTAPLAANARVFTDRDAHERRADAYEAQPTGAHEPPDSCATDAQPAREFGGGVILRIIRPDRRLAAAMFAGSVVLVHVPLASIERHSIQTVSGVNFFG